jgi:hypothetical protein
MRRIEKLPRQLLFIVLSSKPICSIWPVIEPGRGTLTIKHRAINRGWRARSGTDLCPARLQTTRYAQRVIGINLQLRLAKPPDILPASGVFLLVALAGRLGR